MEEVILGLKLSEQDRGIWLSKQMTSSGYDVTAIWTTRLRTSLNCGTLCLRQGGGVLTLC